MVVAIVPMVRAAIRLIIRAPILMVGVFSTVPASRVVFARGLWLFYFDLLGRAMANETRALQQNFPAH